VGGARRTQNTPSWWAGKPDRFGLNRDHQILLSPGLAEIKDPSKFCPWCTAFPVNGPSQPLSPSEVEIDLWIECPTAHRVHRCGLCSRTQTKQRLFPKLNPLQVISDSYLLALFSLRSELGISIHDPDCYLLCLSSTSTALPNAPLASKST
jgi:hypothetical protein